MKKDSRGIALTNADEFALGRYEDAVEQFASYVGDHTIVLRSLKLIDISGQSSTLHGAGFLRSAAPARTSPER